MIKNMNTVRDRFFTSYILYARRHPWHILLYTLLLLVPAVYLMLNLRIDAQLEELLPKNTPTIKAMKETNKRFGSADLFTIAIQMDDPVEIAKVQYEIKEYMEKNWEDAQYVQIERNNDFFIKNALLYIPPEHLERITGNLSEIQLELGMNNTPFGVDLLSDIADEEPSVKKKRVWFEATLAQELGLPDEAAEAFSSYLKPKQDPNKKKKKEWDPKAGIPDSLKNRLIGLHRDGTWNGVIQAALRYPSSNTDYVKTVLARTKIMLDPIRARYGDKIDVGIEGSYLSLKEVESLAANSVISLVISVGLVIIVILLFFRSLGALVAILVQVATSIILTMGVASIIYGRLNMYTAFVAAILLGMGIDYSIHVLGHAQKAAIKGADWADAFIHTLKVLFHPMALAAVTTIAGLLTLLAAEFPGFYEFGVIASFGIVFSVISAMFLLPPLIFIFDKTRNVPVIKWLLALPVQKRRPLIPTFLQIKNFEKFVGIGTALIIIGTVILVWFIPGADFEHDFANLRDTDKSGDSKRHTGVAISSSRKSSQPIVALAKEPKTMELLHDTLLHRLTVEKDPLLRSFLTLKTFVPPPDLQEERMEVIEEIDALINARVFDRAKGKDSSMIHMLRDMVDVEPFDAADIPPWALRLVQERDGSYGRIGFIYGSFQSSNALAAAEFQNRYGKFRLNNEDIWLYSSAFIYADIIRLVKSDSKKMAYLISIIIVLTLGLTLRSFKLILIAVLGLGLGAVWTVGWMGLLNAKLGPFNLIVIPTILGVSIDSIIHLTMAYRRYGSKRLRDLFGVTGTLVTASVVTTLAGYAGMLFTTHQGIQTIGHLAIIGFTSCLVIALFVTPWLCRKLRTAP